MSAPAAPAPLSYGPVQKYRYACCGASAAPRATRDAHVAEPRSAYRVRLAASTAAPHRAHRPFLDELLAPRAAGPPAGARAVAALQPRQERVQLPLLPRGQPPGDVAALERIARDVVVLALAVGVLDVDGLDRAREARQARTGDAQRGVAGGIAARPAVLEVRIEVAQRAAAAVLDQR